MLSAILQKIIGSIKTVQLQGSRKTNFIIRFNSSPLKRESMVNEFQTQYAVLSIKLPHQWSYSRNRFQFQKLFLMRIIRPSYAYCIYSVFVLLITILDTDCWCSMITALPSIALFHSSHQTRSMSWTAPHFEFVTLLAKLHRSFSFKVNWWLLFITSKSNSYWGFGDVA